MCGLKTLTSFKPWMSECGHVADESSINRIQHDHREELLAKLYRELSYRAGNKDAYSFKEPIKYNFIDIADFAGITYEGISSGSGDVYELQGYFNMDTAIWIKRLFELVLDYDGSICECLPDELDDNIESLVEEFGECDITDREAVAELNARVKAAALSFDKLGHGDLKGLENDDVDDFIEHIHHMFPTLTKEFIASHLRFFIMPVFFGCGDYFYQTFVFTSDELYWWDQYKHKVPEDIRENIDNAVSIFSDVFPDAAFNGDGILCVDNMGQKRVLLFTTLSSPDASFDLRPEWKSVFWQDATVYLGQELPKLRQRYGDSLCGESPCLFFMCPFPWCFLWNMVLLFFFRLYLAVLPFSYYFQFFPISPQTTFLQGLCGII